MATQMATQVPGPTPAPGPSPALRELMEQELLLRRRLKEMQEANGIAFYRPYPKHDQFHRNGDKRLRGFFGGNRSGKSTLGCAEDIAFMLGERPWYPKNDPARTIGIPGHSVKGIIVCTNWDKVDEVFTSQRGNEGKLWKFLPRGYVKDNGVRRGHEGVIEIIEGKNDSLVRFTTVNSWKNDPKSAESSDWDFIHFDEPGPELMWKALSRGLIDRNGCCYFTLTALEEPWIYDMFFDWKTDGLIPHDQRWATIVSMHDNLSLDAAAKERYLETLTPEERSCRENGLPLALSGIIYKEFDWSRHVLSHVPSGWNAYNDPPKDYTIYYHIDPHPQTNFAVLFCAVSPHNQLFFFEELWTPPRIDSVAQQINAIVQDRYVARARIDPHAFINDPITETNMADEFLSHGIFVEKATKALMQGIPRVRMELAKNPGRLFFSPWLKRTLWEIKKYRWKEDGENKPVDKDDHMMENLYRTLLDDPIYIEQSSDNREPIPDLVITRGDTTLYDLW